MRLLLKGALINLLTAACRINMAKIITRHSFLGCTRLIPQPVHF
jgi:hypothetical protein